MKQSQRKNIDDVQPQTVENHFDAIIADETFVDSIYSKKTVDDLPSWFDEELFKRGQLYYDKNVLSVHVAYLTGLIAVFIIPTIAKILTFTKQSSTPCLAFKRYLLTTLLIVQLHDHDVKDSKSKFYKALNTIRWKHSTASKRSQESKHTGITQRDMVLTQFAFVGYVLVKSKELGFTNDTEDRQAFNHFWRVVGYLLDIPDRINLCRKNVFETTLLCEKIMKEVISNKLENPISDFHFLTETSLQGLRSIDPTIDTDVFYKIFYEIHGNECAPIIGKFSRIFWNYYVRALNWIAENFPFIAWIKYGQKQAKINLYLKCEFTATKIQLEYLYYLVDKYLLLLVIGKERGTIKLLDKNRYCPYSVI